MNKKITKEFVDDDGDVTLQLKLESFYGGIIFSSSDKPTDSGWWTVKPVVLNDTTEGVIPDDILIKIRDILNKRFPV